MMVGCFSSQSGRSRGRRNRQRFRWLFGRSSEGHSRNTMNKLADRDDVLSKAFRLASLVHGRKETALRIVMGAMAKSEVATSAQGKRLYFHCASRKCCPTKQGRFLYGSIPAALDPSLALLPLLSTKTKSCYADADTFPSGLRYGRALIAHLVPSLRRWLIPMMQPT